MQVNYNDLPEDDGFGAIPQGLYPFVVSGHHVKNWPDGAEKGVSVEFTIEGPKFAGWKVFDFFYLNPRNSDPDKLATTLRINGSRLKNCSSACGFSSQNPLTDTAQLIGKRGLVKLGHEKNKATGEIENSVKGWQPLPNPGAAPQVQSQPSQAQHVPPAPSAPQNAPQANPFE